MQEIVILKSETQIGEEHLILHERKTTDTSNASRFQMIHTDKTIKNLEMIPTNEAIMNSIEKLSWFIKKTTYFAERITFYVGGIKEIGKLSRKWELTWELVWKLTNQKEELTERAPYDKITWLEFIMLTLFVTEELSCSLDLPLSNRTFSKNVTKSSFPYLTREIDSEIDLLNTINATNIFSFFSSSQ